MVYAHSMRMKAPTGHAAYAVVPYLLSVISPFVLTISVYTFLCEPWHTKYFWFCGLQEAGNVAMTCSPVDGISTTGLTAPLRKTIPAITVMFTLFCADVEYCTNSLENVKSLAVKIVGVSMPMISSTLSAISITPGLRSNVLSTAIIHRRKQDRCTMCDCSGSRDFPALRYVRGCFPCSHRRNVLYCR